MGKPESANPPAAPAAAASQPSGVFHASGRELVLATLEAEGAFLKNFLRKGLRKMFSTKPIAWIEEQAEEAFQNLHLRALEVVSGFDPTKPAGPWLTGIALRVLQETNPNRRKTATLVTDLGDQGQRVLDGTPEAVREEPLERLGRLEDAAQLRSLMAGLVEGDREVLRLVMLEERDTEEVARILRTTREQVHLRKCRALKRLRKLCSVDTAGTETSVLVEEGR